MGSFFSCPLPQRLHKCTFKSRFLNFIIVAIFFHSRVITIIIIINNQNRSSYIFVAQATSGGGFDHLGAKLWFFYFRPYSTLNKCDTWVGEDSLWVSLDNAEKNLSPLIISLLYFLRYLTLAFSWTLMFVCS